MTALIVIVCIALTFALLLSTKIILRIKYEDKLVVYLRILFIKIPLYPKKDKKKQYPHSMSRRKAKKIKDSLTKKKKKSSNKKKDKDEKTEKKDKNDVLSIVSIITSFVKHFLKTFVKSARIKIAKLHIIVATENAAKTAILFGAVSQAANVLFPMLEGIKTFKNLPEEKDLSVDTDFLVDKPSVKADITLYVRVGGALKALIGAAAESFKKAVSDQMKNLESKHKYR